MLKMRWKSVVESTDASVTPLHQRSDLQIRNLLDDPRLRRACGLDPQSTHVPAVRAHPHVRFDRRRLLETAAA